MQFITAQWRAPKQVKALTTTRLNGFSEAPFDSLNLGDHVEDDAARVAQNRTQLLQSLDLDTPPQWLQQVHGTEVVKASSGGVIHQADACWSDETGQACVVMTADCLPVFFTDKQGQKVAVAHAGWRGLLDGVLENTLDIFNDPEDVFVWFGPAIGPSAFEVGEEVLEQFAAKQPDSKTAFEPVQGKVGKYLANIYQLAEMRLKRAGVSEISGCDLCTYTDQERFFSYRRDGKTGRMASLIWIEKE